MVQFWIHRDQLAKILDQELGHISDDVEWEIKGEQGFERF